MFRTSLTKHINENFSRYLCRTITKMSSSSSSPSSSNPPLPFGTPLGTSPKGVTAFSSDYKQMRGPRPRDAGVHTFPDGTRVRSGAPFQCVEYSRRSCLIAHNQAFADVGMAYEIFGADFYDVVVPASEADDGVQLRQVPAFRCENGKVPEEQHGRPDLTPELLAPPVDFCVVWLPIGEHRHTGHVATITETVVAPGGRTGVVRIAEQNVTDASWEGRTFARELPATIDAATGAWTLSEPLGGRVLGWIGTEKMLIMNRARGGGGGAAAAAATDATKAGATASSSGGGAAATSANGATE